MCEHNDLVEFGMTINDAVQILKKGNLHNSIVELIQQFFCSRGSRGKLFCSSFCPDGYFLDNYINRARCEAPRTNSISLFLKLTCCQCKCVCLARQLCISNDNNLQDQLEAWLKQGINIWRDIANNIDVYLASTNERYNEYEKKKVKVPLAQVILISAINDLLARIKGISSGNAEQMVDWAQTVDHLSNILRVRCIRGKFSPSETTAHLNENQYDNAWFEFLLYGFKHDLFNYGKKKESCSETKHNKKSLSKEERIEIQRFLASIGIYDSEKLTIIYDEQDGSDGHEELNFRIKSLPPPDFSYLDESHKAINNNFCKNCSAYCDKCLCLEQPTLGIPCMRALIERYEQKESDKMLADMSHERYQEKPWNIEFLNQWLLRYTAYLNNELLKNMNLSFISSPQERYNALMKAKQKLFV